MPSLKSIRAMSLPDANAALRVVEHMTPAGRLAEVKAFIAEMKAARAEGGVFQNGVGFVTEAQDRPMQGGRIYGKVIS